MQSFLQLCLFFHYSATLYIRIMCCVSSVLALRSLEVFAVLWWKFVPRISRPCPWFTPHSWTDNLFGFNQSASWLMIFFSLPFLTCLLSVIFLFSSLLQLTTLTHSLLLFRLISLPVSFSMPLFPIYMLMLWLCWGNVAEFGWHSHAAHIAFILAGHIKPYTGFTHY